MLKNYFQIAIAVLKRRKFFTFISLFGISFTLTILIVATAFVDNMTSNSYPEVNRGRSLYITMVQQRDEKNHGQRNGPASYYYLDHYVNTLKTPVKVAISSFYAVTNAYVNNKKLAINLKYTNDEFWDVFQYKFIEGKPYTLQQINNGERVAVISEDTRKNYFGDIPNVIGKYIEADNVRYKVIGVVKSVPVTMPISYADIYLPYTVIKTADYKQKTLMGNYTSVMMAASKSDVPKMKAEYAGVVAKIEPDDKDYNVFRSIADPYVASLIRNSPLGSSDESGISKLILISSIFILFFMLLPTLNLVNINISRIMERSSEIGVRKAFGASSTTLVGQFIVENLILTFLGCIIGIIISFIIIQVMNNADMIANLHLSINGTVLLYSMAACIIFGLLSGVYPAWRMSRLQVVTALKSQ